jgi:ethanolamine ammonia-lyase small subunit
MNERDLKRLVEEIAARVVAERPLPVPQEKSPQKTDSLTTRVAAWTGGKPFAATPVGNFSPKGDLAFYLSSTPARLGAGRCGTRIRTKALLDFLLDHATAKDAVNSALLPSILEQLGLVAIRSAAENRRVFLLRPDLGRRLTPESATLVSKHGQRSPTVQIVVTDGLSAHALNVNLPLIWPVLLADLQKEGAHTNPSFFIENGRVGSGDEVARLLDAKILCTLTGERPGLRCAESMGAYVTYVRGQEINESKRNMVSNIHKNGLSPVEAGHQIAALCLNALKERRTGVGGQP